MSDVGRVIRWENHYMNQKFEHFTGGMKLSVFVLIAVTILAIYTLTSDASVWVQAGAIAIIVAITILFICITSIGKSS